MQLLVARNINLVRNGVKILSDCNLTVEEGTIHAIIGVNGSGKTSLAYVIMGCYKPTSGEIYFNGKNITNLSITERAKLGITLAWQEPARIEGLTVLDYLRISLKGSSESEIYEILNKLNMPPEVYLTRELQYLSGGERKRVELASVYLMKPKLAILDEPDSGIDMLTLSEIFKVIEEMRENGSTILLITHNENMLKVADIASVMCEGRILRTGDPTEIARFFKERCRTCPKGLKR